MTHICENIKFQKKFSYTLLKSVIVSQIIMNTLKSVMVHAIRSFDTNFFGRSWSYLLSLIVVSFRDLHISFLIGNHQSIGKQLHSSLV
jgi:hypothetical protein